MLLVCIINHPSSWEKMEQYNRQDVIVMQDLYYKLLPWIKSHPSYSLYHDAHDVCPTCASTSYQRRGYAVTLQGKYQRYQCTQCGSWFRGVKTVSKKIGYRSI